jgi:hypothetical protein
MDQTATIPSSEETAVRSPRILIPFDKREAVSLSIAAEIARKCERTMRNWCVEHDLGRRIGGHWAVSRVALAMYLDGDEDALAAYHDGARAQYGPVAEYYRRLGLGDLMRRPEFGGCEEEAPQFPQPTESPQDPPPRDSAFATDLQDDYSPHNQAPNAEGLGLVEPERMTPDMILASVADDPKVKEAAVRWDRATPSTHYDLVRARDEAQARTGIPVAKRAFLYSAEVDSILLPIVMCMAPGDEAATAQALTRDFNERYRDLGSRVLAFCLSTYRHGNIDGLKRAAGVA